MAFDLPEELMFNIFTRLPVKTLVRCTSVCKPWKSLVLSPSFILSHLNRLQSQTSNNHLLLVRTCSEDEELYSLHHDDDDESFDEYAKLDFPLDPAVNPYYRIVGSCNGVLCLTDDQFTIVHNTILWNPSIRKWVSLPVPRVTSDSHPGFDFQAIGFGYDPNSDDYKVVRIVHEFVDVEYSVPPEVDVYTLSTGTWRNISHLGPQCYVHGNVPQAYLNGAVHWTGSVEDEYRSVVVVSFHVGDEVFRILEATGTMSMNGASWFWPAVIQGSLSLVEHETVGGSWRIWVMKEYGVASSWTILFEIETESFDRIIGFRKNGELLFAEEGDLVSYDPNTEEAELVGIYSRTEPPYQYSLHAVSYTESLVLIGSHVQMADDEVGRDERKEGELGTGEDEVTSEPAA